MKYTISKLITQIEIQEFNIDPETYLAKIKRDMTLELANNISDHQIVVQTKYPNGDIRLQTELIVIPYQQLRHVVDFVRTLYDEGMNHEQVDRIIKNIANELINK